jgi:hypothetical protein
VAINVVVASSYTIENRSCRACRRYRCINPRTLAART